MHAKAFPRYGLQSPEGGPKHQVDEQGAAHAGLSLRVYQLYRNDPARVAEHPNTLLPDATSQALALDPQVVPFVDGLAIRSDPLREQELLCGGSG